VELDLTDERVEWGSRRKKKDNGEINEKRVREAYVVGNERRKEEKDVLEGRASQCAIKR
jgi:hypothetical protein